MALNPRTCICPVCKYKDGEVIELLGTGFIVKPIKTYWNEGQHVLVTAKHIFDGLTLDHGERVGIFKIDQGIVHGIIKFRTSPSIDLAFVKLNEEIMDGMIGLEYSQEKVGGDKDVLCHEYSSSGFKRIGDSEMNYFFHARTHKGNIMSSYSDTLSLAHLKRECQFIDLSFPALQGSSGAPILLNGEYSILGMIVANRESHLIAAQILSIDLGENRKEEISYFLPTGTAIDVSEIINVHSKETLEERDIKEFVIDG